MLCRGSVHLSYRSNVLRRSLAMQRNIEIKAKVENPVELEKSVQALGNESPCVFDQEDVFFKVSRGRLKMRYQTGRSPELIFYQRENTHGPKLSNFSIVRQTEERAKELEAILSMAVGVIGRIQKRRKVYMIGQTRIHIDHVQNLGNFLEFEVVLRGDQSIAEGEEIAKQLCQKLSISPEHLIDCAYMDLVLKKNDTST